MFIYIDLVHGYSLLRPTLNIDYFHELFDVAGEFGIDVEGHREIRIGCAKLTLTKIRYRDGTRGFRVSSRIHRGIPHGRQWGTVQARCEERRDEVWDYSYIYGETME